MFYDDDRDDYRPREVRATCGECGCSTTYHAQGCPETPDDEDDRPLDELTTSEQRARLRTLSMADLIEQCLESLDDAALHRRMYQRAEAARLQLCRQLDDANTRIVALKQELRWVGLNPAQVGAA